MGQKAKSEVRKLSLVSVAAALVLTTTSSSVAAETIFESGTLGPTGISWQDALDGLVLASSVDPGIFSGVRFELTDPVMTTEIGGHFLSPNGGDFFGAIVQLDNETDFPDSGNLSSPDVLGTTLLPFPVASAQVFGDLALSLDPGWYALVYGSGLFGAAGYGAMPLNNPDVGNPNYIGFQRFSGVGWVNLSALHPMFRDYRFVIQGRVVPEPSAILNVWGIIIAVAVRRDKNKGDGSHFLTSSNVDGSDYWIGAKGY